MRVFTAQVFTLHYGYVIVADQEVQHDLLVLIAPAYEPSLCEWNVPALSNTYCGPNFWIR